MNRFYTEIVLKAYADHNSGTPFFSFRVGAEENEGAAPGETR
jgi:hypothetical protein